MFTGAVVLARYTLLSPEAIVALLMIENLETLLDRRNRCETMYNLSNLGTIQSQHPSPEHLGDLAVRARPGSTA
jgi:hypothetical protein